MGFFDDISSIKGKKGLFTIVLTATVLTIFEILFFYNIVVPSVEDEMNANIKKVSKQIAHDINERNKNIQKQTRVTDVVVAQGTKLVFNDTNKGILQTMAEREKILTDDINNYTMYTGVVIVLLLATILYFLWTSVKSAEISADSGDNTDMTDMTDATMTALFTVGVLIAFQILFYFYGRHYKYPGTSGNEELLWVIISSIEPAGKGK
ncbi:hypothetical protein YASMINEVIRUS_464 [Yasminevirus sp. GU-2018]|uniref:Uncharacterized protein n=1 Tax=Yasminevirus sp. GU-2018 TaxID=2420051 RepID=A0A5K0U8X2_9VIRU|nr:hypothetical protein YASMINEVIRUS_464 [Yasminevirus sp. GU-2018]